ncbi:SIS domain-containing protein [Sporolactobacillus terrae]|uniref:Tagatose-6-phosphate ketose isomerase n=1 Tax=Sporolactobacillus terrae TaxID=269673 RepID=A0ABX5Q4P2_9BACL|nr:SIS domain-containing protein [Sporolactobacillus terrae]QAA21618.1 tagatose-6-phosphate ketose isomerase [Sporolactobacillus terrae]QAA24590.1 tagatose-6-phosphate ketose isomerase [Sporolactobacillus terrae]UAK16427.1 SIS domain-containing protein [Sporolactobacillus terrae]
MFNYTEENLREKKATCTVHEILQQPKVWNKIFDYLKQKNQKIQDFLDAVKQKHGSARVLFVGAGTSAYVGDTLTPIVRKYSSRYELNFESIATTDIVCDPLAYLNKEEPTIIVSFARSGNSPESVAAVELAEKIIDHCYLITITCNASGALAKRMTDDKTHLLITLPEESNDRGFAMTSSFTGMLYAAYLLFVPESLKNEAAHQALVEVAEAFMKQSETKIPEIGKYPFERVIYLGSSALGKLTHEAALKCLELNAGKLDTYFESSMGFRHGPKSLQTDRTLIIVFGSSEEYTRAYDIDIVQEVAAEPLASHLIVLCAEKESTLYTSADVQINFDPKSYDSELLRSLIFILFAQMFALHHSLELGITPDNPSPDGKVNRVVKGVKIHTRNN